jgi:hypothetical protein
VCLSSSSSEARECAWTPTEPSPSRPTGGGAKLLRTSWVLVIFGESHLEVLYLTNSIVRSPCPETNFPKIFPSKLINFYPPIYVYGLTREW